MHRCVLGLMGVLALSFSQAQVEEVEQALCPDAKLLSGKLITDICWDCLFPIKIAGVDFGGGEASPGATNDVLCACDDNLGIPIPGFVGAMWEPARIIEVVRGAGCSPSLGGLRLPLTDRRRQGTHGGPVGNINTANGAFMHYHYFAFPLLVMLEMLVDEGCNKDGFSDFDLMYFSEIDPTWNNEELAFFTHPEASAVANPAAIMACSLDAIAATTDWPRDELFWCAGSWGHLYPFSGFFNPHQDFASNTALLATRAIASLHRRGLARRTMGRDALCDGQIWPTIPKTQYKLSMFFPKGEGDDAHPIGEWSGTWAPGTLIPAVGEDAVYVLYRWNDCCITY